MKVLRDLWHWYNDYPNDNGDGKIDVTSATPIQGWNGDIPLHARLGGVSVSFVDAEPRNLCLDGVEVLRRLSVPVRDANWGTYPVRTLSRHLDQSDTALTYRHDFAAVGREFSGRFDLEIALVPGGAIVTAAVELLALQPLMVNRAGFSLLHPLEGVAGSPLTIRDPAGHTTTSNFPEFISPGQTARDIAGLAHRVGHVMVDITMEGEAFEMEDQRNWSDASFKTYCRPLAKPHPFALHPGTPLHQRVVLRLAAATGTPTAIPPARSVTARMPQVALAHEPGLSVARDLPDLPILARLSDQASSGDLADLADVADLTLELVAADRAALLALVQRCRQAGLRPSHVVALPQGYLASHQPEGPWPEGATPDDFTRALQGAFDGVAIGAGSLTNFTEFNRCRPNTEGLDFVTFGNTAVVHAADDLSVIETLEALPHILSSARKIVGDTPLRLGLMSIGMRSNPYGARVMDNPHLERVPMARHDPRQATDFAAAYAVGVLAAAATGGVESLALAMPNGPLGMAGPLGRVILAASRMAGAQVTVTRDADWISITGQGIGLAANLASTPRQVPGVRTVPPYSAVILGAVTE